MARRRFTIKQKLDKWAQYNGHCWRCRLKIDASQKWHWGHIIDLACGGLDVIENLAPEHAHCNKNYADKIGNTKAAKIKRVRAKQIGVPKESTFPSAEKLNLKWNWSKRRYEPTGRAALREQEK